MSNSLETVKENLFYSRAVEAAIWGMPAVNFDAMRQAYFRDLKAKYNDIAYYTHPADWKCQITTPNHTTLYGYVFHNLEDGPVVVEVPRIEGVGFFSTFDDAWNRGLMDLGPKGFDEGKGCKYFLMGPGYTGEVPEGYVGVTSPTNNVYWIPRLTPVTFSSEDVAYAIAYFKKFKIYPFATPEHTGNYIEIRDNVLEGIANYDISFYESLARVIKEEPVEEKDLVAMGQAHMIGIGKAIEFNPDEKQKEILEKAIVDAHTYMISKFEEGVSWWPERKGWVRTTTKEMIMSNLTTILDGRMLIDDRAALFYGGCAVVKNPAPNQYLKSYWDSNGEKLNGSNNYKLHIPANVPTTQFWGVNVYALNTAGFLRDVSKAGADSINCVANSDGSWDVYFGPEAPVGKESNWIPTIEGKNFFVFFRNYGADKSVFDRTSTWIIEDIEKI